MLTLRKSCLFIAVAVLTTMGLSSANAQPPSAAASQLRFSFNRTPWQDVLQWLAKSADLSLHITQLPPGSFTYADPNAYTPEQAIDRINLFLIPQRYSLVRTRKLLCVISLDDETSLRQLDAIAPLVSTEELAQRNPGEVVTCLFSLGSAPPDQAVQELSGLLLIREPALFRTANQLLVTDTAAKLQTVHKILIRLAESADPAAAVRAFDLGHLDPERTLAQIRPHVGLEPLAMTGAGISFSLDSPARRLYASGSKDKLQILDGVLKMIRNSAAPSKDRGRATFKTHPLAGADLQTVVSVLQSLLADEDVRLAPDAASNQIAVLATDDIHTLVEKTIAQLAQTDAIEFKAIPLGAHDLRQAMVLLHGILGIAPDKPVAPGSPRIDADPATNRLLVRAKASQIAEIERILEQLHPATPADGAQSNQLPSTPRLAVFYLEHSSATEANRLLRCLLAAETLSLWESATTKSPFEDSPSPPLSPSPILSSPWTFNTATILADSRLNRIFAYGSPKDLVEIEKHLNLVDRESSITEVRIHGSPRVIQLNHAKAADVAAVVRDAYAGRIAATASERREAALQVQRQQQNPQNPRGDVAAAAAALLANTGDSSQQPTMTLATDTANNAIIVTAPRQLADEVERLAKTIDDQAKLVNDQSAEVVRVIPSRNAAYVHAALKRLQGETIPESKPPPSNPSAPRPQPRTIPTPSSR
jgi:hypothetical protein